MKNYLPNPFELLLPLILATIFTSQSQDTSLPPFVNLPIWAIFFITQLVVYVVVRMFAKIAMEDNNQSLNAVKGLLVLIAINLAITTCAFFGILYLHPHPQLTLIQWVGYPSLSLFVALSEVIAIAMIGFMT